MLTQETLKSLLHYDPKTGVFTRGKSKNKAALGTKRKDGYMQIFVNGGPHLSHRLAWLYMYGYNSSKYIDHIDNVKSNNCISNLRECTNSENLQNRISPQSNNKTSKYLGVTFEKQTNKFRAQICIKGKRINIGRFNTEIEAYQAYLSKKHEIHPFSTLHLST